jgi:hypothetical protein
MGIVTIGGGGGGVAGVVLRDLLGIAVNCTVSLV